MLRPTLTDRVCRAQEDPSGEAFVCDAYDHSSTEAHFPLCRKVLPGFKAASCIQYDTLFLIINTLNLAIAAGQDNNPKISIIPWGNITPIEPGP
jgi:hypothetical protein